MPVAIPESAGYEGTVDEPEWADLIALAGGRQYGVADAGSWKVTAGTADREVRIAPGRGFGYGIRDKSTSVASLTLPSTPSGSRWHLIMVHRDWQANASTFDTIPASTTPALPARATTPGNTDDQPIALVRVAAGSSQVAELRDLRVWGSDGGAHAIDELVLQYLNRLGTRIRIGARDWLRGLDGFGAPQWYSVEIPAATSFTPNVENILVGGAGSSQWGEYQIEGGRCRGEVKVILGQNYSFNNQPVRLIPPLTPRSPIQDNMPVGQFVINDYNTGSIGGWLILTSGGRLELRMTSSGYSSPVNGLGSPISFGVGDQILLTFDYRV